MEAVYSKDSGTAAETSQTLQGLYTELSDEILDREQASTEFLKINLLSAWNAFRLKDSKRILRAIGVLRDAISWIPSGAYCPADLSYAVLDEYLRYDARAELPEETRLELFGLLIELRVRAGISDPGLDRRIFDLARDIVQDAYLLRAPQADQLAMKYLKAEAWVKNAFQGDRNPAAQALGKGALMDSIQASLNGSEYQRIHDEIPAIASKLVEPLEWLPLNPEHSRFLNELLNDPLLSRQALMEHLEKRLLRMGPGERASLLTERETRDLVRGYFALTFTRSGTNPELPEILAQEFLSRENYRQALSPEFHPFLEILEDLRQGKVDRLPGLALRAPDPKDSVLSPMEGARLYFMNQAVEVPLRTEVAEEFIRIVAAFRSERTAEFQVRVLEKHFGYVSCSFSEADHLSFWKRPEIREASRQIFFNARRLLGYELSGIIQGYFQPGKSDMKIRRSLLSAAELGLLERLQAKDHRLKPMPDPTILAYSPAQAYRMGKVLGTMMKRSLPYNTRIALNEHILSRGSGFASQPYLYFGIIDGAVAESGEIGERAEKWFEKHFPPPRSPETATSR